MCYILYFVQELSKIYFSSASFIIWTHFSNVTSETTIFCSTVCILKNLSSAMIPNRKCSVQLWTSKRALNRAKVHDNSIKRKLLELVNTIDDNSSNKSYSKPKMIRIGVNRSYNYSKGYWKMNQPWRTRDWTNEISTWD